MIGRLMIAAAAAITLLTACTGVQLAPPPAAVVSTHGTIADEKAYAQALNVYNTAATIYLRVHTELPAERKAATKLALQNAKRALDAARTALAAANAETFQAQVALALQFTGQAQALLPKG